MRLLFLLLLFALIGGPIVFLVTAMEPAPSVDKPSAAQPGDAARATAMLKRLRKALKSEDAAQRVSITEGELNSAFALAARGLPLRGRAQISAKSTRIDISTGLPQIPIDGWLNVGISILPAANELRLAAVKVGRYELPPGLVMPILGFALDAALGDGLGGTALSSIDRVTMKPDQVSLSFNISADQKAAVLAATKSRIRQGSPFGSEDDVRGFFVALHQAASEGRLPKRGSFAPYLRFSYQSALDRSKDGDEATALRAAFLALAVYCGETKLQSLVGNIIPEGLKAQNWHCREATLAGRSDLRQHFIVSAALKLASDSGLAFAVGEFKELLDANRGGSGFSFDDIAADRTGIRFAEVVLGATTVPIAIDRSLRDLTREADFFPSIAGLPSGMTSAEFSRKFGNADSANYREMLVKIDARINKLALYASR